MLIPVGPELAFFDACGITGASTHSTKYVSFAAGLSGLGTIIPQLKPVQYYVDNYPDGPDRVLGFLSYDLLFFLQLNHLYSAWYFYGLIALLGAQLMACSSTTQVPMVKVRQRSAAAKSTEQFSVA